jgi:hypothetical protein
LGFYNRIRGNEMSLKLGKSFDRSYDLRLPFLNGYCNIEIYFNKKSTFLLFSVEHGVDSSTGNIKMFKNLVASKFCETFLELHNYRKNTLDITNQFKSIKPEYYHDVSFILNESINLSKIELDDERVLFDCLNIYGFTLNAYENEYIFLITERQNIVKKLNKKIVRTSGIQIASTSAIKMLNEYHQESLVSGRAGIESTIPIDSKFRKSITMDSNGD